MVSLIAQALMPLPFLIVRSIGPIMNGATMSAAN